LKEGSEEIILFGAKSEDRSRSCDKQHDCLYHLPNITRVISVKMKLPSSTKKK